MFADVARRWGISTNNEDEPWRRLHRYWLSKHVEGRPPARGDIDPITEIPRVVANMMLIDATNDGYVYRFVGTEVVSQTGQDLTGQNVGLSRKYAFVQTEWIAALDFVWENRQPRLLTYRFEGQPRSRQLVLLLPLHAEPGGIFKILGGLFRDGGYSPGLQADGVSVRDISS